MTERCASSEAPPARPTPRPDLGTFYVFRNARVVTLLDEDDDSDRGEGGKALQDVWVGGGKIIGITSASADERSHEPNRGGVVVGLTAKEIDATDMTIVPGFVDLHVHASGGGGELGFPSRTPEANLDDLIEGGVTTFVSTLGTDTVTRTMENLLGKTRALASPSSGLTGLAWLGGYSFPVDNTLTGCVRRDVTLIPDIIGVGEIAISDHRGSHVSAEELTRLASEVRVAGMVSGKAGITYCHMGDDESALRTLRDAVERNKRLVGHLVPTHVERSEKLVEEGMVWMRSGGRVDFAGRPDRQRSSIQKYTSPLHGNGDGEAIIRERLSISSDSYGSIPEFDDQGNVIKYDYGKPSVLLGTFLAIVYEDGVPFKTALRFFTRNPATVIRMDGPPRHKGTLCVGGDADFLVLKLPTPLLPDDNPRTTKFGMDWPSTAGVLKYLVAGGCTYQCSPI